MNVTMDEQGQAGELHLELGVAYYMIKAYRVNVLKSEP